MRDSDFPVKKNYTLYGRIPQMKERISSNIEKQTFMSIKSVFAA